MNHYNNERRPARRTKSVYRGLKAKTSPVLLIVIGVLVIIIIVLLVIIAHMSLDNIRNRVPEGSTANTTESAPPTAEDIPTFGVHPSVYTLLAIDNGEMQRGDLILVNREHAYAFSENEEYLTIYGNSSSRYYSPRDASLSLKASALYGLNALMTDFFEVNHRGDMLIRYAYMTEKEQSAYYDRRLEAEGYTAAEAKYEKPGYSDHHTGLAVDLAVFRDGATYEFDGTGEYAWLLQNCADYGFISRYPDGKSSLTGIAREVQHLRYVGAPHSVYIEEHGLCLEEYIELLKSHNLTDSHLSVTDSDGVSYEIYRIAASTSAQTSIQVPAGKQYSISGDNDGGLIVTVKLN